MTNINGIYSDDELVTGEAVALSVRPASYVLRAAGLIIDVVVYLLVLFLAALMLSFALQAWNIDQAASQASFIVLMVFCLVGLPCITELLMQGRSLGKLATGLRVVREDGGAIQFRHAFIRSLVGFFEVYATAGGGAAITGLLTSRTKRLGDILAGTYAQSERVPQPSPRPAFMPPALAEWASIADVAPLPAGLSRRIGQFVDGAATMTAISRMGMAMQLANEVSVFVSPVPGGDPLDFLVAVTTIRRRREELALANEARRLSRLEPTLSGTHG